MKFELTRAAEFEFLLRPIKGLLNEVDVLEFHRTRIEKGKKKIQWAERVGGSPRKESPTTDSEPDRKRPTLSSCHHSQAVAVKYIPLHFFDMERHGLHNPMQHSGFFRELMPNCHQFDLKI
jgi:hypothetical protein